MAPTSSFSSSSSPSVSLAEYVRGLQTVASQLAPDTQLFFGADALGEVELHLPPVVHPSEDPPEVIDALLGFDAPPQWEVLVVSTGATMRQLNQVPPHPASGGSTASSARLTIGLDRAANFVSQVQTHSPEGCRSSQTDGLVDENSPPNGFLVNLMRRVMGLPNSEPQLPILTWWHSRWLVAILELVTDPGRVARRPHEFTLREVAALHPGVGQLPITGATDALGQVAELRRQAERAAHNTDWTRQRLGAAGLTTSWLSPELAMWCDNAVFAGLAFRDWPTTHWALDQLSRHLEPSVLSTLREVVNTDSGGLPDLPKPLS